MLLRAVLYPYWLSLLAHGGPGTWLAGWVWGAAPLGDLVDF